MQFARLCGSGRELVYNIKRTELCNIFGVMSNYYNQADLIGEGGW